MTGTSSPHGASTDRRAEVVPAAHGDADIIAVLIADAFHDLPPTRWLIPDADERRQVMPRYFRVFTDLAIHAGRADLAVADRQIAGAALWLPVTPPHPELPAAYDKALAAATGRRVDRFRAFGQTLDDHHPYEAAHHHLMMIAVAAGQRAHGVGAALLGAHHRRLALLRLSAYLEAASPASRRLYLRHGYRDLQPEPLHLPDGGPPLWPMWRAP